MSRGLLPWLLVSCCFFTPPALAEDGGDEAETEVSVGETGRNQIGFRAADPDDHKENLSGIPYMAGAYLVFWVGLFLYMLSLRKRFQVVEDELADLRRVLAERDA